MRYSPDTLRRRPQYSTIIQGNKKPKTSPKPIHNILLGREDREVNENAYPDTIFPLKAKIVYYSSEGMSWHCQLGNTGSPLDGLDLRLRLCMGVVDVVISSCSPQFMLL